MTTLMICAESNTRKFLARTDHSCIALCSDWPERRHFDYAVNSFGGKVSSVWFGQLPLGSGIARC